MADFKRGAKVDADFGDGYQIAFVLSGPTGHEDKYVLQSPANGQAVSGFAFREADDVDGDSGLTFKSL